MAKKKNPSIQDRIKSLRRVTASKLKAHPLNWRLHPEKQKTALRKAFDTVGFADAILVRERDDGELEIIDGHLRAQEAGEEKVPVLVLDVDKDEASYLLTTYDTITGLAEKDQEVLSELVESQDIEDDMLSILGFLDDETESEAKNESDANRYSSEEIPESYEVVIECETESTQKALYDRLSKEGYKCRTLAM